MMNDFDWSKFNEIGEHVKSVCTYIILPLCVWYFGSLLYNSGSALPLSKKLTYKRVLESFVHFLTFIHTFSSYENVKTHHHNNYQQKQFKIECRCHETGQILVLFSYKLLTTWTQKCFRSRVSLPLSRSMWRSQYARFALLFFSNKFSPSPFPKSPLRRIFFSAKNIFCEKA